MRALAPEGWLFGLFDFHHKLLDQSGWLICRLPNTASATSFTSSYFRPLHPGRPFAPRAAGVKLQNKWQDAE
jgi:hypothetical protein